MPVPAMPSVMSPTNISIIGSSPSNIVPGPTKWKKNGTSL